MHWLLLGFWGSVYNPPVVIRSRNSSPSLCYCCRKCQCWFHALCFAFWCQLFWHPPGIDYNFLNNKFSVTILCNQELEISWKWLPSSVIVERRFTIMRFRTCSTRSMCSISCTCCRPAVNCLHQRRTNCLLMTLGHRPGTDDDRYYALCIQNFIADCTSQSAGAGIEPPTSTAASILLWELGKPR